MRGTWEHEPGEPRDIAGSPGSLVFLGTHDSGPADRRRVELTFVISYNRGMGEYLPPGWPTGVHPPGSEDFERTAVAWLLDVVPPDYRLYGALRRYPVALATMARHHVRSCVAGSRRCWTRIVPRGAG